MYRKIITLCFSLLPLTMMADEVSGMIVQKNDGTQLNVDVATLRSIKFSDGQMLVIKTDNSQMAVNIDDVSVITFGNISLAVAALSGDGQSQQMTITDLSGRVVYKGLSHSADVPQNLHGTYIITVNGTSRKIAIR